VTNTILDDIVRRRPALRAHHARSGTCAGDLYQRGGGASEEGVEASRW
jgi:hypothetical protein